MSARLPADINTVIDGIAGRTVPAPVQAVGVAAMLVGIVGLGYGLASGNAVWTWGAFLVAIVYVLALAQGGVLFAVVLTLTEGRWGRPLKRIGEVFGMFLPIGYVGLLIFLLAGNGLYPWHDGVYDSIGRIAIEPHSSFAYASKPIWLDLPFFIARQALAVGLLMALDLAYVWFALRPDLIRARARLGNRAPGWWSTIAGTSTDWQGSAKGSERVLRILSVLISVVYAMVFSFMAFDLIMSLAPWWFSNMFGAWFFASSFWIGLAALGITGLLTRDWLGIRAFVTPKVMHDLGKLCLAFCMFWAYTAFAQILPIWYGNMHEETFFLRLRFVRPEWAWLSQAVGVLCFLTPFTVLVSRGIKKMQWPFILILATIMVGIFLERTMLVMPSIWKADYFPVANFLIVSVGIWVGSLGAFFTFVVNMLAKLPPIGVADPFLEEHPWDVHVHSLDHGHDHGHAHH